jgi:hypothetical protein
MSTVSHPAGNGNSPGLDMVTFAAEVCGIHRHRGGHADEAAALLADPDYNPRDDRPDDADEALADMIDDQTVVQADALHTDELRAAYAKAKELVGVAFIKLGRQVTITDAYGPAETASQWFAIIDHTHYGTGDTADEALSAALANLDKSSGVVPAFGGFTIPGIASVLAFPHRDKGEALALARRIALRPTYLETCVQLVLPGIVDERPKPIAVAVTPTAA